MAQQQLKTCRQVDNFLKFKLSIRMENKDNLSDFECNVVVGARWADFSISETTNLLLFFAHFYGLWRI